MCGSKELAAWRNGIETAGMKRMAAAQTPQTQPDPTHGAMMGNGLGHVLRASGAKAAGRRQQRRKPSLVKCQRANQPGANHREHRAISFSTSARSRSRGASSATRRGLKTIQHLAGNRCRSSRISSRSRRRMRFRWTDLPTARGSVNPKRGPSAGSRSRQNAVNKPVERRHPRS